VTDSVADKLRGMLASDVYTAKGRLRADDLLVRERVSRSLAEATARLRDLAGQWRADRVPPSTRENPFPPAEVMGPLRQADRLGRDIESVATAVRGLPLLPADKVWEQVRRGGLDELMQFDWALVGEADELAALLASAPDLAAIDQAAIQQRMCRLTEVIADRRRYAEVVALRIGISPLTRSATPRRRRGDAGTLARRRTARHDRVRYRNSDRRRTRDTMRPGGPLPSSRRRRLPRRR
jgi:hypothetical protein